MGPGSEAGTTDGADRASRSRRMCKLGDGQRPRGYYSALLVREGDGVKIFEETVNVAVP